MFSTSNRKESLSNSVIKRFTKKFHFSKQVHWKLPLIDCIFDERRINQTVPQLMPIKSVLNQVKDELNVYPLNVWSKFTEKRDPGSAIASYLRSEVKAEFVTRAWCKLYECLSDFPIVKVSTKGEFNSVHLCEAPGAFIAALNHFLKLNYPNSKFNWRATSLNPHYVGNSFENAIDDRLIIQTYDQWEFGEDFTGDITCKQNVDQLVARCKEMGEINLVTADGSVDCVDCPNDQENKVHKLNFAEVVAALQILDMGGSFVLKMFTFFELTTISLLYFLVNIFDTVDIFKPVASKQGNSEVYVVCIGYQRNNRNVSYVLEMANQMPNIEVPMFPLDIIPADFIEEVKECAKMFMLLQKKAIQTNIFHFHNPQCNLQHIQQLQYEIKKEFCRLYRIKPISDRMKLLNLKKRSKKGNGFGRDFVRTPDIKKFIERIVLKKLEDMYGGQRFVCPRKGNCSCCDFYESSSSQS